MVRSQPLEIWEAKDSGESSQLDMILTFPFFIGVLYSEGGEGWDSPTFLHVQLFCVDLVSASFQNTSDVYEV